MFRTAPLILLLLTLGVLLPRLSPPATADTGPLFNPATGHWYQAISAPGISWEEARDLAAARTHQGLRGYLATMTSAEENAWAAAYLPEALEEQHFLGGFQPGGSSEPGGGWQWITGEPWRYTYWGENQPDNSPDEYVLTFLGDGTWNDLRGSRGGYVVEYGLAAPSIPPIAFAPPVSYELNTPGRVDARDFDGDGHLDLAVSSSNDLAILYGLGDGTFGAPTYLGVGSPVSTDIGETVAPDVDRDGRADLVTAGGDSIFVYRSTGNRTYGQPQRFVFGIKAGPIHSADFNKDGYPDLAVTSDDDNRLGFLLNKGDGTFHPISIFTSNYPGYLAGGDWNRDGNYDLAVANVTEGAISLYRGDGTGAFTRYGSVSAQGEYPIKIVTDDFDGDGLVDLISGNYFSHTVGVMFGNGDGTFRTAFTYPAPAYPHTLAAVDLDGDGDSDIASPHAGARHFTVLRNNNGIPGMAFRFSSGGSNSRNLSTGDFNEDGRPDIVISSESSHNVTVHLNETGGFTSHPPAPPTNLVATAFSSTQVDLAWTDASANETSFELERRTDTGVYTRIARPAANATTFRDSRLTPSTRYRYRLRAVNAAGNSAYSNQAVVTTLSAVPSAPTGLKATIHSPRTLTLQWTDTSSNEIGFQVERRLEAGIFAQIGRTAANVATLANAVSPRTVYYFRVRALGPSGHSAYTPELRVQTPVDPPTAPAALRATTVSASTIRLDWTDLSNNETGFEIERRTFGTAFTRLQVTAANAVSFTSNGLQPNTIYLYRVRAIGADGSSEFTADAGAQTLPQPPVPPTELTAQRTAAGAIRLDWRDNSSNERWFDVERRWRSGPYVRIADLGPNSTTYSDTDLSLEGPFTYRIRAVNEGGPSGYTNAVVVTFPPKIASFTVQPTSVRGGRGATGTIRLTGPALSGGAVITLSSNLALVKLPATVVVAAGASTATVPITTRRTRKTTSAILTATYNGASATASLKVKK
jgi:hypothetical protein